MLQISKVERICFSDILHMPTPALVRRNCSLLSLLSFITLGGALGIYRRLRAIPNIHVDFSSLQEYRQVEIRLLERWKCTHWDRLMRDYKRCVINKSITWVISIFTLNLWEVQRHPLQHQRCEMRRKWQQEQKKMRQKPQFLFSLSSVCTQAR